MPMFSLSASARLKCLLHFIVTLAIPSSMCVLARGMMDMMGYLDMRKVLQKLHGGICLGITI